MSAQFETIARGQKRPDDAVTVEVIRRDGAVLANVVWPANAETAGGDYLYPTELPLALTRAEDVRRHYGFGRIVVRLTDAGLWDERWGRLIESV